MQTIFMKIRIICYFLLLSVFFLNGCKKDSKPDKDKTLQNEEFHTFLKKEIGKGIKMEYSFAPGSN